MPTTRRGSALLAVCLILAMLFSSPAVPARAEVEAPRFLYVLAPPYGIFFDLKLMIVDTEGGGVDFSDLVVEPEEAPTSGHLLDLGNGVIFFDPDDDAVDGPGELVNFVVCSGESWCTTVRVLLLPVPVKRVVVPYGTTATVDVRTDLANGVNAEDPVHATGLTVSVIELTGFGALEGIGDFVFEYARDPLAFSIVDTAVFHLCSDVVVPCFVDSVMFEGPEPVYTLADLTVDIDEDTHFSMNAMELVDYPEVYLGTVVYRIVEHPEHGHASIEGGQLDYSPEPDFNGLDTFVYEVCVREIDCLTATATVTVNPVNDPVRVADIEVATWARAPVTVPVASAVNDPDLDDEHTVTIVSGPAHGEAVVGEDGSVVYTPSKWFAGADGFEIEVTDSGGTKDRATVTVTVTAPGEPIARDLSLKTTGGEPVTVDLETGEVVKAQSLAVPLAGGVGLAATITRVPNHGEAKVQGTTVTYTPAEGFEGTDSLQALLCSADGVCEAVTLAVTVVDGELPFSGADAGGLIRAAALAVSMGGVLVLAARRRSGTGR